MSRGTDICALFPVKFPMHQVDMMKFYGVTPIVVLDGSALPGKAGTNQARRDKRKEQMAKGKEVHTPRPPFRTCTACLVEDCCA